MGMKKRKYISVIMLLSVFSAPCESLSILPFLFSYDEEEYLSARTRTKMIVAPRQTPASQRRTASGRG